MGRVGVGVLGGVRKVSWGREVVVVAHLMSGRFCVINDFLNAAVEICNETLLVIERLPRLLEYDRCDNGDSEIGTWVEAAVGFPLGVRRGEGVRDTVIENSLRGNEV